MKSNTFNRLDIKKFRSLWRCDYADVPIDSLCLCDQLRDQLSNWRPTWNHIEHSLSLILPLSHVCFYLVSGCSISKSMMLWQIRTSSSLTARCSVRYPWIQCKTSSVLKVKRNMRKFLEEGLHASASYSWTDGISGSHHSRKNANPGKDGRVQSSTQKIEMEMRKPERRSTSLQCQQGKRQQGEHAGIIIYGAWQCQHIRNCWV